MRRVRIGLVEKLFQHALGTQHMATGSQPQQLLSLSLFAARSVPSDTHGPAAHAAVSSLRRACGAALNQPIGSCSSLLSAACATRSASPTACGRDAAAGLAAVRELHLRCSLGVDAMARSSQRTQHQLTADTTFLRRLSTRAQQQRAQRLGRAGWRDNPNEQALYLV